MRFGGCVSPRAIAAASSSFSHSQCRSQPRIRHGTSRPTSASRRLANDPNFMTDGVYLKKV